MDQEELVNVLSEDIDDSKKISLIEKLPSGITISILGKNYFEEVQLYILRKRYMSSDMSSLFKTFSRFGTSVQEEIINIAQNQTSYILNHISEIDTELKTKLMLSNSVTMSIKISILIKELESIDEETTKKYLHDVDKDNFAKIFDRNSRTRFENTNDNAKLLKAFEDRG